MESPYTAVVTYLENEGVVCDLNKGQVTELVQTVLGAVGYSTAIVCPDCGAEVDTRSAKKI